VATSVLTKSRLYHTHNFFKINKLRPLCKFCIL